MIIVAIGWVFLALPGAVRRRLESLDPIRATRLTVGSLSAGLVLVLLGLASMIAPTLLEGLGAHHLAVICRQILHDLYSGGHVGGVIAAVAFLGVSASVIMTLFGLRRARGGFRVERWVGWHQTVEGLDVAIIPTPTSVAVAGKGQVVLSTGLVERLSSEELEMVIRHELTHLKRHHHRYLDLAAVVKSSLGWLPLVARSTSVLRFTVERWADEEAAGIEMRGRQVLASALLAALPGRPGLGLAGFAEAEMVAGRIRALAEPPTRTRPRFLSVITAFGAWVATMGWLGGMAVIGVSVVFGGTCLVV